MVNQQPPRTTPRRLTQDEINRMSPEEINQAVQGNQPVKREMEPRNLGDVIRKSDPITGIDYKQSTNYQILQEAGLVPVWNLTTGTQVTVLKNLLPMKLSQYNEQGQKVFSLYQSDVPEGLPYKMTFPCMLHEDHELRPLAKKLGYPTCKTMMRSEYYVQAHTKKAHRGAFDSFNRDKIEGEKAEEREWRRTSMAAFTQAAFASKPAEQLEKACTGCGDSVFALNEESLDVKLNVHMRACKPYTETFGAPEPITTSTFTGGIGPVFSGQVINAMEDTTATFVSGFVPVNDNPIPVPGPNPSYSEFVQHCKNCDVTTDAKSKSAAMSRMRAHVKKEHPDAN